MRDDLKHKISSINRLLQNKLKLLHNINKNESAKLSRIRSGKLDELDSMLLSDSSIIDEINIIDYEIKIIEDDICRISGMDRDQFFEHVNAIDNPEINRMYDTKKTINSEIRIIVKLREENISAMESENRVTQEDIDQLERIKNIRIIK